jgi:hypothetical protein
MVSLELNQSSLTQASLDLSEDCKTCFALHAALQGDMPLHEEISIRKKMKH